MNLSLLRIVPAILVMGFLQFASAAPYLVYQGTLTQSTTITAAESASITAKINSKLASFHKLPKTLQAKITGYLKTNGAAEVSTIYMITDETNVANYALVCLDPTATGGKIAPIDGASFSASDLPNNFISGFEFPVKGGLGIFRFALTHPTGTDPVTGNPASYVIQGYGTGAINDTVNFPLAPKEAAFTFYTVVNGVKQLPAIMQPAFPAILSTVGNSFMPTISGTVFGYYFDDSAVQSIGGASTKGTFALKLSPVLTELANNGGRYVVSAKAVGNVAPVQASTAAAYKAFIKSLSSVHP